MAVKNTSTNRPIWEQLGYSSAQAYLNAMSKPSSNGGVPVATPSSLAKYASIANPSVGSPITKPVVPTLDNSAIRKNLLDSSKIGVIGGSGVVGGVKNPGGITNEGVIIGGNTGNLVQLPQINTGSSKVKTPSTSPLDNYAALIKNSPTIPTSTPTATTPSAPVQAREERTDEGSYNGTSDFLEAFKENYGYDYDGSALTRREGMSDGTWNSLQSLYKYYQQGRDDEAKRGDEIQSENEYYDKKESELAGAYDSSRENLGENKGKAQQNASISLDKLLKYLPGASEGARL